MKQRVDRFVDTLGVIMTLGMLLTAGGLIFLFTGFKPDASVSSVLQDGFKAIGCLIVGTTLVIACILMANGLTER